MIYRKSLKIYRLKVTYAGQWKRSTLGRFGGGWNWELGIQIGSKTIIINLLICFIIFNWGAK